MSRINRSDIKSQSNQYDKHDNERPLTMGIFKGVVKDTYDVSRTGRLRVHIPTLSVEDRPETYVECYWTSPFAGSTDPAAVRNDEIYNYEHTQKSYGMWMVPPDINNQVLVAFGDGIGKYGYVISCLFHDRKNHMVPGMPGGLNKSNPELRLPVAEKNKYDARETTNDAVRSVHADLAEAIVQQGLINDPIRGAGTSGARRESPSQVFGILTPGPRDHDPNKTSEDQFNHRIGGHQFIMDDAPNSRMIRLRTAQGNQLLMDDTTGVIYAINKSGTAWFEMGTNGDVTLFSEGSINMRAKQNFNLRADKNINLEAGQNINIKAAGDNAGKKYLGTPSVGSLGLSSQGVGGNIRFEAASDLTQYAGLNAQLTANGGDIDINSGGRFAATANGTQGIDLNAMQGPTKIQSKDSTSVLAGLGFNVTSGSPTSITASQILLNSGGPQATSARTAATASQIGTNSLQDNGNKPPEFDRDAARQGNNAVTTGGQRTGNAPRIDTIVSVLATAEPYRGHGQMEPLTLSQLNSEYVQEVVDLIPPGGTLGSNKPADLALPDGIVQGLGYTDANGNPVNPGELNLSVENALEINPRYGSKFTDIANSYNTAKNLKLTEIQNLQGMIAGIRASVPPVRFQTSNALSQRIIGLGKELNEIQSQLNQFMLDSQGNFLDMLDPLANEMKETINSTLNNASSFDDAAKILEKQGIEILQDGDGFVFKDKTGNMLVDFNNGIGDVGATLGEIGSLNETFNSVKSAIDTPLTDNQTLGLASFAQSIGEENFMNSNVLAALNQGKISEVPRLMNGWVKSATAPGEQSVVQPVLQGMRAWQGSIFQSPDSMDIDVSAGSQNGEMSFEQQAAALDSRREKIFNGQ